MDFCHIKTYMAEKQKHLSKKQKKNQVQNCYLHH